MVFRIKQFEAIPSIMSGTPNLTRFTNSKLDKSDALKEPTADQITGSQYGTKIGNIDVGGECSPRNVKRVFPGRRNVF